MNVPALTSPDAAGAPALGEADLLADLQYLVPSRAAQGRCDEFGADVAFAQGPLVHGV